MREDRPMLPLLRICFCLSFGVVLDAGPPNILWITVEDMSPRLGCYGDRTVPTPNVDRLAAEGRRYTHAFGVYGVCAPNRHAIILGMYPTSTGAMAMRTWKRTSALAQIKDPELLAIPTYEATPPPEARCFPEYLRVAGYYATNNVKTDYQFRPPLTAWDESSRQAHWRHRPKKDMPFFAVFNYTVTHESGTFEQRSQRVVDPASVELPPYYPDTPIVRRDLARHYDNIAAMDKQVGERLAELEADGLLEETIVFFFSDHGDGLPRMKRWVYDSGIRVPLIIRFPGRRDAGTVEDRLVSFVDFAPTVLALAGLSVPEHMEGRPFLGAETTPRRYIHACRDRMDPAPERIRAVRDRRFKYIRNYRPDLPYLGFIPYRDRAGIMQEIHRFDREGNLGPKAWQFWSEKKPLEELYDTESDPHEIHNLAADPRHFAKLAELREAHAEWLERHGDLGEIPERELIRRLWPPEGAQPRAADPTVVLEKAGDQVRVTIGCESPGASIAYRPGRSGRWRLYTRPFLMRGDCLEARANRLGWQPSETVRVEID